VNGVKTTYLVDSNRPYAQVLEEYEDENLKVRYIHGLDLISVEQDGEVSVYLVDGLGSTRVLTDLDGEVVATYTYDAFGELLDSTGEVENDYLFAGEQFDGELEQYYLRQRFYDAETGRFTRRDTWEGDISQPLSLHKYIYTHADPINYIDPSGESRIHSVLATYVVASILIDALGDFFNPLPVDIFSVNIPTPQPLTGSTSREVLLRPSSDIVDTFTDLNMHRADDALPAHIVPTRTGSRYADGVVARFDVGGRTFYGYNSRRGTGFQGDRLARNEFADVGFLNPSGRVPFGAFANHAEGHVFIQAYRENALFGHGKLFVDYNMCDFCGGGGVKNIFLSSGLDSLEVFELDEASGLVIKNLYEK
jgi:RHS repeat-associated protein